MNFLELCYSANHTLISKAVEDSKMEKTRSLLTQERREVP